MAKTKTTLCKLKKAKGDAKLPGTIYARNGRYWYKVQFPGEAKFVACPFVLPGSKYATTDPAAALKLAQNIFYQSIYKHHEPLAKPCETVLRQ